MAARTPYTQAECNKIIQQSLESHIKQGLAPKDFIITPSQHRQLSAFLVDRQMVNFLEYIKKYIEQYKPADK